MLAFFFEANWIKCFQMLNSVLSISLHGYNLSPFNSYQLIFRAVYEPFLPYFGDFITTSYQVFDARSSRSAETRFQEYPEPISTFFYQFISLFTYVFIIVIVIVL